MAGIYVDGWQSTPTQAEIDLARNGINTDIHEWDGSPVDPQSYDPTQPPGGPPGEEPDIVTLSPTTGPLPNVNLIVTGTDFANHPVIVFNGVALATTQPQAGELRATVSNFAGGAGMYDVLVRSSVGDSNVKKFTFTSAE